MDLLTLEQSVGVANLGELSPFLMTWLELQVLLARYAIKAKVSQQNDFINVISHGDVTLEIIRKDINISQLWSSTCC